VMHAFFAREKKMIHKLTSSQAHIAKPAMTRVWLFVRAGLLATSLVGCGPITNASGNSATEFVAGESNTSVGCIIDAGIVFADEASYLCVPLSRLGIADADEVLSVDTSCDCSRPSIVHFDESPSKTARALRIDFIPEPVTARSKHATSNLSVVVTLRLREGRTTVAKIKIKFVHIVRAQGAES